MVDKNKAVITFLLSCDAIKDNEFFFNFGNIGDNANQLNINSSDVATDTPYIDGSVLKRYTCHVDTFKSATTTPLVSGYSAENVDDMADAQAVIDWINNKNDDRVYPDFGTDCIIDNMKTLSNNPDFLGIDSTVSPPLAVYRISIQIDYVDNSKKIWS